MILVLSFSLRVVWQFRDKVVADNRKAKWLNLVIIMMIFTNVIFFIQIIKFFLLLTAKIAE